MLIKILYLSAEPARTAQLRLGEERRTIREELERGPWARRYEFEEVPALRPPDLTRALLRFEPQIVHFSVHGESHGPLLLEDSAGQKHEVFPEELASVLMQFSPPVRCVVLNACFSLGQAKVLAQQVAAVVGVRKKIFDRQALSFSLGFYQALVAGKDVATAFALGKAQLGLQGMDCGENLVLFGNTRLESSSLSVAQLHQLVLHRRFAEAARLIRTADSDSPLAEDAETAVLRALVILKGEQARFVPQRTVRRAEEGLLRVLPSVESGERMLVEGALALLRYEHYARNGKKQPGLPLSELRQMLAGFDWRRLPESRRRLLLAMSTDSQSLKRVGISL